MWSSGLQFRRVDDGVVERTRWKVDEANALVERTRWRGVAVILVAILTMCLLATPVEGDIMGDECDWFGSGLSGNDVARSVTPVYLRCSQGEVTWVYPRGALRVLLRLGGTQREFRGCIRTGAHSAGARLFLEARRSLRLMRTEEKVQCFTSSGGQAAIYVEATRSGADFTKETVSFSYDLEPLPRDGAGYNPADECRPCTNDELARAYCTSDLVTRGIITAVENLDTLDVARITVHPTKLLRRSTDVDGDLVAANAVDFRELTMFRARHCGAKHGPGEYVLMARRKLGELALTCAPTLEEWAAIRRTINREDNAQCQLDS